MEPDHKYREACVFKCPDGRVRAFTHTGICLGIVTPEADTDTDTVVDEDPVGAVHGLIIAGVMIVTIVVVTWLTVEVIAWIQRGGR